MVFHCNKDMARCLLRLFLIMHPIVNEALAGIEAEVRAVQYSATEDEDAAEKALDWWRRNFAHIYPLYEYNAEKEQVVRRRN